MHRPFLFTLLNKNNNNKKQLRIKAQCMVWFSGYLLDPNGEKCVTAPRQVSALHHKDVAITMAAASSGATVVVTEKGDVYLLAEYQCKKIASRSVKHPSQQKRIFYMHFM